jgi:hypothetical protein
MEPLYRRDRYTRSGEHLGRPECTATALDFPRRPPLPAIPNDRLVEFGSELSNRKQQLHHHELPTKGLRPFPVLALYYDLRVATCRGDHPNSDLCKGGVESPATKLANDGSEKLKGDLFAEPDRATNLDQIRKGPNTDMSASSGLVNLCAYDAVVQPIVESSTAQPGKTHHLLARE